MSEGWLSPVLVCLWQVLVHVSDPVWASRVSPTYDPRISFQFCPRADCAARTVTFIVGTQGYNATYTRDDGWRPGRHAAPTRPRRSSHCAERIPSYSLHDARSDGRPARERCERARLASALLLEDPHAGAAGFHRRCQHEVRGAPPEL